MNLPSEPQGNGELPQSEINRRLALWWLLNPETAPLESFNEDVQRIVSDLQTKLPSTIADDKTQALIEAHMRQAVILREANGYADKEEAKKLGRKILAERNGRGPSWAPINIDAAWDAAEAETQTDVGHLSGEMPLGVFYRGKINGVHAESEAAQTAVKIENLRRTLHLSRCAGTGRRRPLAIDPGIVPHMRGGTGVFSAFTAAA